MKTKTFFTTRWQLETAPILRISFLLAFILLATFSLSAQDEEDYEPMEIPEFYQTYCPGPNIIAKAVVHYEGYSKLFLRFEGVENDQTITIQALDQVFSQEVSLPALESEVLVTDIPAQAVFEIKGTNACEEEVVLGTFSTVSADIINYGIEVSKELNKVIIDYQTAEPPVTLLTALDAATTVSPYEKLYFIQQFYLDGESFTTDAGTEVPDFTPPPTPPGEGECRCKAVHTALDFMPGSEFNGTTAVFEGKSNDGEYNSKSSWWWRRNTAGPAKWHYYATEGWKAGNQDRFLDFNILEAIDDGATTGESSPHMAQIGFNFVCENQDQYPRDCDCVKKIHTQYLYNTQVEARSHLLPNGVGDKSSVAYAQDIAVVTLRIGNGGEAQVIDGLDVRAETGCSASLNPEWFINALEVAGYVANGIVLAETGSSGNISPQALNELIQNLVEGIGNVIQTPITLTEPCTTLVNGAAINGGYSFDLPVNTPASVSMFSFSNLGAGGKRRWQSHSSITSEFSLSGYSKGAYVEGQTSACCSDASGVWVSKSAFGPAGDQNLREDIGFDFALSGIDFNNLNIDQGTGRYIIWSDYGRRDGLHPCVEERGMVQNPNETIEIVQTEVPETDPGISDTPEPEMKTPPIIQSQALNASAFNGGNVRIVIFDIHGRILHEAKDVEMPANTQQYLREHSSINAPGIYFFHVTSGDYGETQKIFVPE